MKVTTMAVLFLLIGITLLSASPSMAQFRGGIPGGEGGGGMRGRGGGRDSGADTTKNQRPAAQPVSPAQTEVIMHELYEDLRLTPAQHPAWQSYADKVQALVSDFARERNRARAGAQLTAMQQFDRTLDSARNHLTALEDIAAAAKVLYDGLAPEQKLIADARLAAVVASSALERSAGASEQSGRRRNSP
jgi:hypothetical protein